MGSVTANLRLNVPDFDQAPWDVDVNTNWLVLDATVGLFAAIPNLTGIWKNSVLYTYGQSAIDPTDSSIWQCLLSHTSSAAPTSFALERATNPARWGMTTAGAQFYATQAAASASAAAGSAAAAAASAASVAIESLPLTGGTMTGFITLSADPTALLHAATKRYADARVGGTAFLPIAGGNLTGPLGVGGSGVSYKGLGTYWAAHYVALGWDGTDLQTAVDSTYTGAIATKGFINTNYLPLSGGSMTGSLYVAGELQANAIIRIQATGGYIYGTTSVLDWMMDSGGWRIRYNRSSGTLQYLRGSDSANLFQIDGGGNSYFAGGANVNAALVSNGTAYIRSGAMRFGPQDRMGINTDNPTFSHINFVDNFRLQYNWSGGQFVFYRSDNVATFILDYGGSISFPGNLSTPNTVTAGYIHSTGSVAADSDVNASNSVYANSNVFANGGLYACAQTMVFGYGGSGRIMQFANTWYWDWNNNNGNLRWINGPDVFWELRRSDNYAGNNIGPVYGSTFLTTSDADTKHDIEPTKHGLAAVTKLNPVSFIRNNSLDDRVEHGFIAQEVQAVIPEAVVSVEMNEKQVLAISMDAVLAAVVNGMKTIEQRLTKLENG